MVETIEYFLDVTRIERGKVEYDMEHFDLKELVRAVAEQMEPTVTEAGLSFHQAIDENQTYPVYGDRAKLKQVIRNLIDNAVLYTEDGSVTLHLWRSADQVYVEVKDTGIGLSKEDKRRIFQKFGRANNAEKRNIFGAGLGLYIAKQILADHEGAVNASSPGRGKGSSFTMTLPVVEEGDMDDSNQS
jgi:signal transduction histidine kinase